MNDKRDILIIDDEQVILDAVFKIAESEGFKVETALNANEAFTLMAKESPDLILLDLLMPKISGFDFLEKIRKDEKTKNTPVIVVSALTDDENVDKIMKMGAIDFVKKPIDLQYLVDRVEGLLHHSTH